MPKESVQVPFGYEPPAESRRGTLIVYDSFEDTKPSELLQIFRFAEEREFTHIVLYPIHEETGRRMGLQHLEAYHRRVHMLQELLLDMQSDVPARVRVTVDQWEGKRKKYTPIETAMDFVTEKNKGPFFVWMTEQIAVKWAGYASFPEWIRRVRMVVAPPYGHPIPPAMVQYGNRWEYVR